MYVFVRTQAFDTMMRFQEALRLEAHGLRKIMGLPMATAQGGPRNLKVICFQYCSLLVRSHSSLAEIVLLHNDTIRISAKNFCWHYECQFRSVSLEAASEPVHNLLPCDHLGRNRLKYHGPHGIIFMMNSCMFAMLAGPRWPPS